jgi:hypothetical protein
MAAATATASATGGGNGNPVGLFDCNGGATTKWQVLWREGRFDYQFQIRNGRNGRCLDYPASSGGADGWQYVLWDCVGSIGQWFRISDFNESTYGWLMTGTAAGITVGPNHHVDALQVDGGANGNRVGNYVWTGSPAALVLPQSLTRPEKSDCYDAPERDGPPSHRRRAARPVP